MELHPDRNYGNIEETTRLFAEVQSAYEVLSDLQERAWYDSHRDAILGNEAEVSGGTFEHNVRLTSAEDLMRIFGKFAGKVDLSDSSTGFYSVLRDTFATLAREEALACEWEDLDCVVYPSFGNANDDHDDVVKPFYTAWSSFVTAKSFSWKDVYRYPDAPDRRIRRLMEKENKRFRGEGIREFNDAVRSLVAFVRKRDPRFKPNTQSEADRQKTLRDAVAAQAARSRAANQAKSTPAESVPDWMMSQEAYDDGESDESGAPPDEHVECVVCKKSFKSEKQYEAHEKSKKHVRAIQQLRRQMEKENIIFELQKDNNVIEARPTEVETQNISCVLTDGSAKEFNEASEEQSKSNHTALRTSGSDQVDDDQAEIVIQATLRPKDRPELNSDDDPSSSSSSDDEYANRSKVESRILDEVKADDSHQNVSSLDVDVDGVSTALAADHQTMPPKLGKAKVKRAKKAAQKAVRVASSDTEFKCAACQAGFPSKTRLFNHIKDLGHAQQISEAAKGAEGKKR